MAPASTATFSALPDNSVANSKSEFANEDDSRDVLHTVDGRTGLYYAIPISKNAINAAEFKKIKASKDQKHPAYQKEQGLRIYDPGFSNTTVSESKITYM
jgi:citrate synthase